LIQKNEYKNNQQSKLLQAMEEQAMKPFDGHFWVVKEDNNIDTYFTEYDYMKKFNKCDGEMKYLQAPPLVQAVMIGLAKKTLKNSLKKAFLPQGLIPEDIYEEEMSKDIDIDEALERKINDLRVGECHITAFALQKKHGGKIAFGSMGWRKKNSNPKDWRNGIHWEFGGADFTTVAEFRNVHK
jgi:hypothetical protein